MMISIGVPRPPDGLNAIDLFEKLAEKVHFICFENVTVAWGTNRLRDIALSIVDFEIQYIVVLIKYIDIVQK